MIKRNILPAKELAAPLRRLYREDSVKPGAIACNDEQFDSIIDCIGLAERCAEESKVFIVTTCHGWGMGSTLKLARANCRKAQPFTSLRGKPKFMALLVHPGTTIDSGGISYPGGCPPIELGEV